MERPGTVVGEDDYPECCHQGDKIREICRITELTATTAHTVTLEQNLSKLLN